MTPEIAARNHIMDIYLEFHGIRFTDTDEEIYYLEQLEDFQEFLRVNEESFVSRYRELLGA